MSILIIMLFGYFIFYVFYYLQNYKDLVKIQKIDFICLVLYNIFFFFQDIFFVYFDEEKLMQ